MIIADEDLAIPHKTYRENMGRLLGMFCWSVNGVPSRGAIHMGTSLLLLVAMRQILLGFPCMECEQGQIWHFYQYIAGRLLQLNRFDMHSCVNM